MEVISHASRHNATGSPSHLPDCVSSVVDPSHLWAPQLWRIEKLKCHHKIQIYWSWDNLLWILVFVTVQVKQLYTASEKNVPHKMDDCDNTVIATAKAKAVLESRDNFQFKHKVLYTSQSW